MATPRPPLPFAAAPGGARDAAEAGGAARRSRRSGTPASRRGFEREPRSPARSARSRDGRRPPSLFRWRSETVTASTRIRQSLRCRRRADIRDQGAYAASSRESPAIRRRAPSSSPTRSPSELARPGVSRFRRSMEGRGSTLFRQIRVLRLVSRGYEALAEIVTGRVVHEDHGSIRRRPCAAGGESRLRDWLGANEAFVVGFRHGAL